LKLCDLFRKTEGKKEASVSFMSHNERLWQNALLPAAQKFEKLLNGSQDVIDLTIRSFILH